MQESFFDLFVDIFSLRMKRGHIHFLIFCDKILCMSVDFRVVWGAYKWTVWESVRFASVRSWVRIPSGPPNRYWTNTYFYSGGFAVKVSLWYEQKNATLDESLRWRFSVRRTVLNCCGFLHWKSLNLETYGNQFRLEFILKFVDFGFINDNNKVLSSPWTANVEQFISC